MTWYWAWCHGVRWPPRSDATLRSVALMLRNSESLLTVLGWHWLSSSPSLQHRCLIRGDHYPSSGFAKMLECDPRTRQVTFFLVTGLEKEQQNHCHSRAGEQLFTIFQRLTLSDSPEHNQIHKIRFSKYNALQINIFNPVSVGRGWPKVHTDDDRTDAWMKFFILVT